MLAQTVQDRQAMLSHLHELNEIFKATNMDSIEPEVFEADYSNLQPLIEKREVLQSEISDLEIKQTGQNEFRTMAEGKMETLKKAAVLHVIGDLSDSEFTAQAMELETLRIQVSNLKDYSEELDFKKNALTALNSKIDKLKKEIDETYFQSFSEIVKFEISEIHSAFNLFQDRLNESIGKFKGIHIFCHNNLHPSREINRQGIKSFDLNDTAFKLDYFLNNIVHVLKR